MKKAYLILSNGRVFQGESFGADAPCVGELVFTTGMCGYIETLTDPSYCGQIIMQTFPLIGNYGIIEEDFEGVSAARGYVVREWCKAPSNFRSQYDIDTFLKKNGIPGICSVDTREITKLIRESGVMNAMICSEPVQDLSALQSYRVENTVAAVSCKKPSVFKAEGEEKYNVTLIDYGAKGNIIRELNKRGCTVTEVPYNTSAKAILAAKPNGVMLSNGPGDPADNAYEIEQLRLLSGKLPIFGICLGHQLLALANGGKTVKLKYGHRGANQPVTYVKGTRTYITSQNHGYAVVAQSLPTGSLSFINANDGTCEGIDYDSINAFSVQFHPEACSGPLDTSFLFDRFIDMMKK